MTIQSSHTAATSHPLIEGKYTEQQLLTVAKSNVTKKSNECSIFNTEAENAVPRFLFNGKSSHHFCNLRSSNILRIIYSALIV
jgi:hypothetical protein